MKKLLLLAVATLFVCHTASAQRFGYGPRVGLNVSSISDKAFDPRINFNAGAFFEYDLSYLWSIEIAAVYSRQGGTLKGIQIAPDLFKDATVRLDYVNVPLVAKFYPWMGMNIFLGPQIGFLVNAQQKINSLDKFDVKKSFEDLDFSGVFGIGYTFDWGLVVSANYTMSVRNNIKNTSLGDYYNGVFQFNIGWRF